MAAPQIPNLNTLLRGRGGRGRGRGRGRGGHFATAGQDDTVSASEPDGIVQRTDDDAAGSRMSALSLGYLHDPFAKTFWDRDAPRRYPVMNRGTYIRTVAIDKLVDRFLETYPSQPKQIISLGAGTDTRYFRILSRLSLKNLTYHELDFPVNTTKKIATIRRSPELLRLLQSARSEDDGKDIQISSNGDSLLSPSYSIHAIDLRNLTKPTTGQEIKLPNISPEKPTLLLSECCLVYMPPADADNVVRYFTSLFPTSTPLSIIIYEPIRPNDPFGQVMISNLAARGIVLQTLKRYANLTRQKLRLKQAGFVGGQKAADMDFLYEQWIDENEKSRVAGLEMLDEMEEWRLLAQHYCVAWGWRDDQGEGGTVFDEAWGSLKAFEGDDEDGI